MAAYNPGQDGRAMNQKIIKYVKPQGSIFTSVQNGGRVIVHVRDTPSY